jgi:hypothetical protein
MFHASPASPRNSVSEIHHLTPFAALIFALSAGSAGVAGSSSII